MELGPPILRSRDEALDVLRLAVTTAAVCIERDDGAPLVELLEHYTRADLVLLVVAAVGELWREVDL